MGTIENLTKAFVGESQARNRYTFYSKIAKKEGFEQIAAIFEETATQENEHAKWLFRLINQLLEKDGKKFESLNIETEVPTTLGNTKENLKSAIEGETYEYSEMYPGFADIAEKEGFPEIAKRLRAIAKAETHHAQRYTKLLKEVENNSFFKKNNKVYWVCRKCGYIEEGETPPESCPSCGHPKSYFQKLNEDY